MAYTPISWEDGAAGATPLSAANLNHMEAGIVSAVAKTSNVLSFHELFDGMGNTPGVFTAETFYNAVHYILGLVEEV